MNPSPNDLQFEITCRDHMDGEWNLISLRKKGEGEKKKKTLLFWHVHLDDSALFGIHNS
jgi:hypothetical protein